MTLPTAMRLSVLVCLYGLATAEAQTPPANPAAAQPQAGRSAGKTIEGIEVRGASHVPADTLGAAIHSKIGEAYDEDALRRDVMALWRTNRFADVQVKTETGARGGVMVRFVVTELPERPLPALASNVIEGIEFRGVSRVPQDTLKATIHTKVGDVYDEETLGRDFKALWNTGRFDDIQVKKETGARGGVIVRFVVIERP